MELKIQDLRIGNYIETENGIDEVRGVFNRNCFKDVFLVKNEDTEIEKVKPIPITEEWLLRLGFEKIGNNFDKDNVILWRNLKTNNLIFDRKLKVDIKYIHELQNLFHSLSGNELEMKE